MANERRKLRRAAERQNQAPTADKPAPELIPADMPDPFGPEQRKALLTQLGLPVAAVWLLGALIAGVAQSGAVKTGALLVPAVLTLIVIGLVVYAWRQAQKARAVQGVLRGVQTAEDRERALGELESGFGKKDTAAIFAKAQLLMQEDPRKALDVLEQIDLGRVMAPVADEARAQRAMLHLMLGEVSPARQLADGVGLDRHQDPRTRAMLSAVVAEAWARSGNAKKAVDTLALFDFEEAALEPVRPQLYRAQAFAAAQVNDMKAMRRALKRLCDQDPRILGGFLQKKAHPLLQKEAKKLLEQSGVVPRRMQVQR